ncbi:Sulfoxide reductase catalytic subunit YedY [Frondihabitans sp. 762G35]|uniref:molybdopterin-dependent oxidoreductase n=1 Tax=Frondihabitans sp. 762G35 TaxID=1446794 RepID=UPI000D2052A4|nr:molybdopterin-dependent oxidoreductase [Frondihabitans sp. 762G35]ARC56666.1 Sulfoxide reductase catalytic subunit YedY [Frondihabitans sp. 762G35]
MTLRETPVDEAAATPAPRPRVRLWAAATGIVALLAFLGSAEVAALFFGAASSPLTAVGSAVIDLAPPGAKQVMVALFGVGDKAALFVLMGILLVIITGLAGLLEHRRSAWGRSIFLLGGVLAVAAVVTRSDASELQSIPALVGTVVAVLVLGRLAQRLQRWERATSGGGPAVPALRSPGLERRDFLRLAGVAAAAAVVLGAGARVIQAAQVNAAALRARIRLPRAAVAEEAVPSGASLDVAGITPYVTPTSDFYRIDTALSIPQIDPSSWTLEITGMVEKKVSLTFDQLLAKPLVEHMATLSCVSNEVGGDLVGNALWLGYPIRDLLAEAKPRAGADMVLSRSIDGFTASTPLSVLQDAGTDALLAVGMNGQPLPLQHGFPARLVVPGLYGYVSATKWVVSLEVTTFAATTAYWTTRGYSAKAPVKLQSRVDTPTQGASLRAGTIAVAGVAWEPHVGVAKVEVRIDEGDWVEATLADSVSDDTWRQWVYRWDATAGSHGIEVRATNKDGVTQSSTPVAPAPNGAEGWDGVTVSVS